ncbi:MAG: prepilin peptidase [Acidobacteriota bacterium]
MSLLEPLLLPAAIGLGLLVGSFLNVCIHRLPLGMSVVHPRSSCPRCRRSVAWYDNVPLLSYLWLGGRCRHCSTPISPVYPGIEAANGALYGGLVLVYGPEPSAALLAAFGSAVLALIVIDLRHRILPDAITLPMVTAGLAFSFVSPLVTTPEAIVGAAAGYGIPWGIGAVYRRLRGREGMGRGDLKMLAMVGAFTGWQGVLFTLGAGSILGACVGIPWALARREGLGAALPFGTFLGMAALADLLGLRQVVLPLLGIAA